MAQRRVPAYFPTFAPFEKAATAGPTLPTGAARDERVSQREPLGLRIVHPRGVMRRLFRRLPALSHQRASTLNDGGLVLVVGIDAWVTETRAWVSADPPVRPAKTRRPPDSVCEASQPGGLMDEQRIAV